MVLDTSCTVSLATPLKHQLWHHLGFRTDQQKDELDGSKANSLGLQNEKEALLVVRQGAASAHRL